MFAELQSKVMLQKKELEDRTDSVNAIQRNFQRLSDMYATDRKKLDEANAVIAALEAELEGLRAEKKLLVALQKEFAASQLREKALKEEGKAQQDALRAELVALANRLAQEESERKQAQGTLQQLTFRLQQLEGSLERVVSTTDGCDESLNACLQRVLDLQRSVQQWSEALTASANQPQHHDDDSFTGQGIAFIRTAGRSGDQRGELKPETRISAIASSLALFSETAIPYVTSSLRKIRADSSATLRSLEMELAAEKENHQKSKDSAREKQLALEQQVADLLKEWKGAVRAHEADRKKWEEQNSFSNLSTKELDSKLESLRKELAAAVETLGTERAEREAVEKLAAGLKSQLIDTEIQLQSITKELNSIQKLSSTLHSANEELGVQLRTKDKNLAQQQQQIAALEAELQRKDKENIQREKDWLHEREQLLDKLSKGSSLSADVQSRLRSLEAQLQAGKAERQEAAKRYASELDNVMRLLTEARGENTKLSEELGEAQRKLIEAQRFAKEDASAALHHQHQSFEALRKEYDALQEEFDKCRGQLKASQYQEQKLLEKQKELAAKLQAAEGQSLAAAGELNKLRRERDDAKSSWMTSEDQIRSLNVKVKELEEARRRADSAADTACREAAELLRAKTEYEQHKAQIEEKQRTSLLRMQQLRVVEEQCAKTVKKVLAAEEACESGYSCQLCLDIFKEPVICAPCGHTYCRGCFEANARRNPPPGGSERKSALHCPECDLYCVRDVIDSQNLDLLSGKFNYRRQQLRDLVALLDKELKESVYSTV
jgi:chromosome segregation ATPase